MQRSLGVIILIVGILTCCSGQHLGFTGNIYGALQNWSKVGDGSDSKLGVGIGGMAGIALVFDSSLTFAAGPHFAYNAWSADYSNKPNSFTENVVFNMEDTGLEVSLVTDDMGVFMGVGTSKMEGYMTLKTGTKLPYPGLDGSTSNYTTAGVMFNLTHFFLGAAYHSYAGVAKDASRIEFRVGLHL